MRMWNISPKKMCNQHLLGEHVELHMLVGTLNKNRSIKGYITNNLIEIHNITKRHKEIFNEMIVRGFKHNSPLPKFKIFKAGKISKKKNKIELMKRCKKCRKRICS